MVDLLFPILGFIVGLTIGMTGMGAGFLMTPLLIFSGIPPVTAVGTDLIYSAISKVFGTTLHFRKGNVHTRLLAYLLAGGVPATLIGSYFIVLVKTNYGLTGLESLTGFLIALILISVASVYLLRTVVWGRVPRGTDHELSSRSLKLFTGVGFLVGLPVQMTSVGSGVIVNLSLLSMIVRPSLVVGTSLAFGLALSALGGMLHFVFGHVDLFLLTLLTAGSIPGILLGVSLNDRVPVRVFRSILVIIILAAGVSLALRYGSIIFTGVS